jgi:CRISPR system Cascade subunit CasE
LLDLRFDLPGLWRSVRHDGKALADADLGYAVHAALFASLGPERAPKPFALLPMLPGARQLRVLGYSLHSAADLLSAAPRAMADGALVHLDSKPLPEPAQWRVGQRLQFSVRARPTVRGHKVSPDGKERDLELDAYHSEVSHTGIDAARSREEVYVAWLSKQFANLGGAELADCRLEGWQLAPVYRKGAPVLGSQQARRGTRLMTLPEAEFSGALTVSDGAAFHALLGRGIGRHRAFGHGMLLVRPA